MKLLRVSAGILGGVFLFFGLFPLVAYGYTNAGIWALSAAGAVLLSLGVRRARSRWERRLGRVLAFLSAAGLAAGAAVSIIMLHAAYFGPPEPGATAIVLGCHTVGDRPSRMLQNRLDCAVDYLRANPGAYAITTGAFFPGDGNTKPEGEVMRDYLIAAGIEPDRIYAETRSTDTDENLRLSAQIIREEGLSPTVAVISDPFHVLRGKIYAGQYGLKAGCVSSKTVWILLPSYWVRELLGLAEAVLL